MKVEYSIDKGAEIIYLNGKNIEKIEYIQNNKDTLDNISLVIGDVYVDEFRKEFYGNGDVIEIFNHNLKCINNNSKISLFVRKDHFSTENVIVKITYNDHAQCYGQDFSGYNYIGANRFTVYTGANCTSNELKYEISKKEDKLDLVKTLGVLDKAIIVVDEKQINSDNVHDYFTELKSDNGTTLSFDENGHGILEPTTKYIICKFVNVDFAYHVKVLEIYKE